MSKPRILILRAPGTNCDVETAYAFELAGGLPTVLHLNRLLETPRLAAKYQVLCIPGGFSYGDDIAAGRIFANQIRHHLGDAMREFRDAGKLVLGICNGFQTLIKSGLLDTDEDDNGGGPAASLAWNDSGRYVDRWVDLAVEGDQCVFLTGVKKLFLPIAHAEGRFVARDEPTLDRLGEAGQLPLRYCGAGADYNPNGSVRDVAGLCDRSGRIFGLMPHPERFVDPTQHPQWTRLPRQEEGAGLQVFRNAVRYFS